MTLADVVAKCYRAVLPREGWGGPVFIPARFYPDIVNELQTICTEQQKQMLFGETKNGYVGPLLASCVLAVGDDDDD